VRRHRERLGFVFIERERPQVRVLRQPIAVPRIAFDRKARLAERLHVAIHGA